MTLPQSAPRRVDYTSPAAIAGGLIAFAIILFAVPVFWLLLPVVIAVMAVLYFASSGSMQKARNRANGHLGLLGTTTLCVELRLGLSAALVFNDWGVVFVRFARRPVELSWGEIRLVDEPAMALLSFHADSRLSFEVDLSQERYFAATRAMFSKIPDKTNFDVDPVSGRSNLLHKLQHAPFEWQGRWGRFIMTNRGVTHERGSMTWDEIEAVREFFFPGDESESYWELRFSSAALSFELRSTCFSDGRQVGYSGYGTIKGVVAERIPDKAVFALPPLAPDQRAIAEFNRCQEACKVGFALALKSGRFSFFERYFQDMLSLVDTFALAGAVDTRSFFRDYAELMSRTGRPAQAAEFEARANSIG